MSNRIVAISMERYRATALQKRMYGGSTVTKFCIYREEDEGNASKYKYVEGFGPTPGDRKTNAIVRSGLV